MRVEVLHKVLLSASLHLIVELVYIIHDRLLPLKQLPFRVLSHSCGTGIHLVVIVYFEQQIFYFRVVWSVLVLQMVDQVEN